MGLETGNFIDNLVSTNPVGSTDPKSQGDDHFRLLKSVLKNTFPGLDRAIYLEKAFVDAASAATVDLGAIASNAVRITGTTTITSFGTVAAGVLRIVRFAGILTLTHNAASLILPGGANIATAADDRGLFVSLGSGNWLCLSYFKTTGKALIAPLISEITDLSTRLGLVEAGNPVGRITDYAGASAPTGWLFCFGQAVSRTTYSALFTALGVLYGVGDGTTTFNLPDYRGRVGVGQDDMGGTSANRLTGLAGGVDGDTLGAVGGSESHILTIAEMPAHTHTHNNWIDGGSFDPGAASPITNNTGITSPTGGGGAHNNVQPALVTNKIIWTGVI